MSRPAPLATFWALSDPVRVEILDRIAAGSEVTVTQLATVLPMTRQAVTRHVRTLEDAGIIAGSQEGREHRFEVEPASLDAARHWLGARAASWDRALRRLARFLEDPDSDG